MYKLDIFRFDNSIEYEYKFAGNYGAKGEKRQKKQKRTPEDIQRQNQYQKSKTVRRLLKANFSKGDYWTTLTYAKGVSKSIDDVSKDLRNFLDRIKRAYKKQDTPCKYIYRIEIGSRGGVHIHIILNRIPDLDILIQDKWQEGHVHNELLNDGTYEELADYIVKPPSEQAMKILKSYAGSEDTKKLIKYSCSRNLKRPEPETHTYRHSTMRRIFNNPIKPSKGFYIDKNSIRRGTNLFTGMGYLHYQEIRLTDKVKAEPVKICECPYCHQFTIDNFECRCRFERRRNGYRKYIHSNND